MSSSVIYTCVEGRVFQIEPAFIVEKCVEKVVEKKVEVIKEVCCCGGKDGHHIHHEHHHHHGCGCGGCCSGGCGGGCGGCKCEGIVKPKDAEIKIKVTVEEK
ncbi:hypothetical protein IWW48_002921 [Coemansia sp. RSA 1200]|nr:hypothetical protein IWW48_002921 [Coemansia sp. RSA 1200]